MLATRPSSVVLARRGGPAVRPRAVVPRRRTSVTVRAVMDVTASNWEKEVLKSDLPVLVDFWAPWCGPCKLVAPLMTWAEKEFEGKLRVVKVEHDAAKELVERYGVYGLPAILVVRDGAPLEGSKREGAITKKLLAEYLQGHLGIGAA